MKGFFKRLGDTWSILGITLLILLLIEVFFRIYLSFTPSPDERANADCYGNADWVQAYFEEFEKCNASQWEPYLYWKRVPFKGEFINVNEQGHRATVTKEHPLSQRQPELKLFFFGGSAMWGTGARDAYTIPSLTGNEMIMKGFSPSIVNFGESGYVSTQDLLSLMNELKNGNVPDVAIFYSGVNDIFSSYQSGKAGIPQNESNRRKEFNTLQEKKKSFLVFLKSLKTLATIKFLLNQFGPDQSLIPEQPVADSESLAEKTVHQYNENIRVVNALAKEYGFQAMFYWQPTIFDKLFRTGYEEAAMGKAENLRPFLEKVNSLLFAEDLRYEHIGFYNLAALFANTHGPLFIDWCHAGEEGNLLISQRIAHDLMPVLDSLNITREVNDE